MFSMKIFFYVLLAMTAFAGNSFFTRLALSTTEIDHVSFSLVRLLSACLIILVVIPRDSQKAAASNSQIIYLSIFLITYIFSFSYAYSELSASIGGLVLFSVVQISLITYGFIFCGHRLNLVQWFGLLIAMTGALLLLTPTITAEHLKTSLIAMAIAGLSWTVVTVVASHRDFSIFSLRKAIFYTASFLSVLIGAGLLRVNSATSLEGLVYAILCGALTTGLGYSIWLLVVNSLSTISAAIAQISVPVITTALGVIFLAETLSSSALSASILIIFGVTIYFFSEYLKCTLVD